MTVTNENTQALLAKIRAGMNPNDMTHDEAEIAHVHLCRIILDMMNARDGIAAAHTGCADLEKTISELESTILEMLDVEVVFRKKFGIEIDTVH